MYDLKKVEEEIIKFWEKEKIPEKARKRNRGNKKTFYMMDGPPYATGHIHMGTALNKTLKDTSIRIKRMQNYDVFDRPGYDTHGIPIEYQIEKEIGSGGRGDIEKYGVKRFIQKCKEFATRYIGLMNKEFENLGVWMPWDDSYLTLSPKYIEAIWWTFKKAEEKGLLYLGKYPVHICPRCETAVAYNEIIYNTEEDTAIFVKFPLKDKKNSYLIIWTTTPWTLPGNTGVMVHPDFVYQEIETSKGERWIIAKELVPKIMEELNSTYKVKREFKGKEMEDWRYKNPLSKNLKIKTKDAYRIVLSKRYVNLEEGSGLVHCAPGHGKEDYEVGKEAGLDILVPVKINGELNKETGKYAGKKARVVDKEIIEDLGKDGFLVHKNPYNHDYPLCWRCKTPLLMLAIPQWFFKISDIHAKLLKLNKETNWIPKLMEKRMRAWLNGISDWPISRQRYWGTPLPIWKCNKCEKTEVIGDIKTLEKKYKKKIKELHKPEIDEVKWKCKCGGEMKRVPEVLDVWFDSGVSSWAALGYPKNDKLMKKFWPADLNTEATDQFRGWWNSQLILSTIAFDKKPFENIMVHGMVTDLEKRKMSKSLGNIITPKEMINKYGRDYLRYYLITMSKGVDFAIDEKAFKDIGKFFMILFNIHKFVSLFGFEIKKNAKGKEIEDKWILSRLNSTIKEVIDNYNRYTFHKATEKMMDFVVNDLSRRYIQITRNREDTKDILNYCFVSLIKLLAPIAPHLTEYLYKEMGAKNSIHLEEFPKIRRIDKVLEGEFEHTLQIIETGLAERDKLKIGLKWPLAKAKISTPSVKLNKQLQRIIANQLNVKSIEIKKAKEISVELDIELTPELEAEGYARELSRKVQAFRKKLGLEKKDKIDLLILVDKNFKEVLETNKNFIKERTNSENLEITTDTKNKIKENFKNKTSFSVKDKKGGIIITKR